MGINLFLAEDMVQILACWRMRKVEQERKKCGISRL